MSTTPAIEDLFLNVRRAYRLLHDYQQMVLNAVRYIGSQLDIPYNGAWIRFGDADIRSGYANLTQTSWNWLPMMATEFHHFVFSEGYYSLSFFVFSDSGFFEAPEDVVSKEDVQQFPSAEGSGTYIAFIMRPSHWDHLTFMRDKLKVRDFIKKGRLPATQRNAGAVAKCYPMSILYHRSGADEIVADIVSLAGKERFPIARTKKA